MVIRNATLRADLVRLRLSHMSRSPPANDRGLCFLPKGQSIKGSLLLAKHSASYRPIIASTSHEIRSSPKEERVCYHSNNTYHLTAREHVERNTHTFYAPSTRAIYTVRHCTRLRHRPITREQASQHNLTTATPWIHPSRFRAYCKLPYNYFPTTCDNSSPNSTYSDIHV